MTGSDSEGGSEGGIERIQYCRSGKFSGSKYLSHS